MKGCLYHEFVKKLNKNKVDDLIGKIVIEVYLSQT